MGASPQSDARFLLRDLLRDVSRSFYLTLRILPGAIRNPIGLAYLLARLTDTIADTDVVPVEQRVEALRQLRERILRPGQHDILLPTFSAHQATGSERILLERVNEVLALLPEQKVGDQTLIRQVLEIITSGQELDLLRFGNATQANILALRSAGELNDYTYRVAGCVGDFWTRICCEHLQPKPSVSLQDLVAEGIRFGQGLQLVNILRDLPKDLREGRCYLPAPDLAELGLVPGDLLQPENESRFRPLYRRWIGHAEDHLNAGWRYVLHLPNRWVRVRLACAWPILIGLQTLEKLRRENVLDPARRIKVSRKEVRRIVRCSVFALPFKNSWQRLPERLKTGI